MARLTATTIKVIPAAVVALVVATAASPALAFPLGQAPNVKPGLGNLNPKLPKGGFNPKFGQLKPAPGLTYPGTYPVGGPAKVPGPYKPHYGYGYGGGWGYGAAALAGGLALGAIAASAATDGDCYVERRRVEDDDGNLYIRRIRVCE